MKPPSARARRSPARANTLTDHRRRPRKRFGQHFLQPAWAAKVVAAINPQPGDVFLEIGPGTGALTLPLAATGVPILAVEIDRDLAGDLATHAPRNVTIITGDILQTDVLPYLSGLEPQRPPQDKGPAPARRFRVVGNLPYNLSTPILFHLIAMHRRHAFFTDATIMLQREVCDRLVAKPGKRDYGVLTVLAGVHTQLTRVLELPPNAFRPAPKVRSAVVRATFTDPSVRIADDAVFERLLKALFGGRRKTLSNALKRFDATAPAVLALSGLDGQRRPDTLSPAELGRLAELFAAVNRPPMV